MGMKELIDNRQTFILDCHGMSHERKVFCGNLVVQAVKNHFRYEKISVYKPLSLFVDECHTFTNPFWFDILKESRKYNISAVLATQDFSLLSKTMKRILLNSGSLICFRSGANEARELAAEIGCKPEEIQFIDKYHCYFMTPEKCGICSVPAPNIFKKYPLPVAKKERKLESEIVWSEVPSCDPNSDPVGKRLGKGKSPKSPTRGLSER